MSPAPRHVLHSAPLDGARAFFTDRLGGVSTGGFSEFNLALHVGDEPANVHRNRELLAAHIGAPVVFVNQVHSARAITLVADGDAAAYVQGESADALVTNRRDIAIAIMVADCVPVLLSDAEAGVVAAAHAGRIGLLTGIIQATLASMQDIGAEPERIQAALGPAICGSCYEVPADMHAEACAQHPALSSRTHAGTPGLDLRAGITSLLTAAGVPDCAIAVSTECTLENDHYFSYRREHRTGRFAGVISRC